MRKKNVTVLRGLSLFITVFMVMNNAYAQYCNSSFTNVDYIYITNVTIGAINNSTGANTGGPVDYSSLGPATVYTGLSSSLSVSLFNQSGGAGFLTAFCDWNQNNILDDAGEVYTLAVNSSSGPFVTNIAVPSNAVPGNVRMRVMASLFEGGDPCSTTYEYGEAEDYTLNVVTAPCTPASAGYVVTSDCPNNQFSVSIDLSSLGSATSVDIKDGNTLLATATGPGTFTAGPYPSGVYHTYTLVHNTNSICTVTSAPQGFSCPGSNDECSSAQSLTPGTSCNPVAGNTVGATTSQEALPSCLANLNTSNNTDVWFSFVVTDDTMHVKAGNIAPDTPAAVSVISATAYSGQCGNLSEIGCGTGYNSNGQISAAEYDLTGLTVGETIYLRIMNNGVYDNTFTPQAGNLYFDVCVTGASVPLPIVLANITANNEGNQNLISWTTEKEDPGDHFELQHSMDGKRFSLLADINTGASMGNYVYKDKAPWSGTNYYRLKLINADGRFIYSKVVTAIFNGKETFSVEAFPNPVIRKVTMRVGSAQGGSFTLTDITGKLIRSVTQTGYATDIDISGLDKGIYLVKYTNGMYRQTIKISKK